MSIAKAQMGGKQAKSQHRFCHWQCESPSWRKAWVKVSKRSDRHGWKKKIEKEF